MIRKKIKVLFWWAAYSLTLSGFVFPPLICAQALPSEASDPSSDVRVQRPLILGVVAFNQERYQDAIMQFKKALAVSPGNVEALNYLLVAAFKINEHSTAVEAGEGLVKAGVNTNYVLFILAKSYREVGNEDKAQEYFQVLAGSEGDPYQDSAEFALAETGFNYRPKGFRGTLIGAYEHDTNVASSPAASSVTGTSVEADRAIATLLLEYNHRIGERWYVGGSLLGFANFYKDDLAKPFENALARFDAHAGLVGKGWDVRLMAEHEVTTLDNRKFVESDRVTLAYNQRIAKNYRATLQASAARDKFTGNPAQDADNYNYEWRNLFLLPFIKEGASLALDYKYQDNKAGSVFGFDAHSGRVAIFSPFAQTFYFELASRYESRDYDQPNPTERSDDIYENSIRFGKVWNKNLRNELYFRKIKNNSTVNTFFTYDQEVTGINAIVSF